MPITVSDCFDRGLRRSRGPWLPVSGAPCSDGNGLAARFALDVSGGVIRDAIFEVTTCVTLVAYAELLAERVTGKTLAEAIRLGPAELIAALPGVPPVKQDRAGLAIRALHRAVASAVS